MGGGAAFDPGAGGIVSPGVVGYDINCLTGETAVLHEHGYVLPIKTFQSSWMRQRIRCFDQQRYQLETTDLERFLVATNRRDVFEVTTATGKSIRATADHPFLTPTGMQRLQELRVDDPVAIVPFQGVEYEPPTRKAILTRDHIFRQAILQRRKWNHQRIEIIMPKL